MKFILESHQISLRITYLRYSRKILDLTLDKNKLTSKQRNI